MPKKPIISDTSCLIILDNIGELDLLKKLFDTVTITPQIETEFGKMLPNWIIKEQANKKLYTTISKTLDSGEASAIALALEKENYLLIIDDLKGRKYARSLNLNFTGTIGIIAKAALNNKIKNAFEILDKIQNTNFRVSNKLILKIKQEINIKLNS